MKKSITKIDLTTTDHREVTRGFNGYPVPVEGTALFADTVEALKEMAASIEGAEIHELHWKPGWSNCEDKGAVYDLDKQIEWNIEELDKANCDSTVMDVRNWDRDQWLDNEEDCFGTDEWNEDPKLRERYNALADEIANAIERGAVAVELHAGQLINEWDASLTMQHDYDSNYWRLGVLLSKSDGWDYTDNYNSFEIINDEDEA